MVRHKQNAPYVTKLANLLKEKNILKQIISQHCRGIDLSLSIACQVHDCDAFLVPKTIPECKQRCRAAQKEIRKLEKDSVTLRRDKLTRLRCEAIQRGDHETAKAIKYQLAAERTKQMYQKLRYIRGIQKTGISRLEVAQDPTDFDYKKCTEWITIDTHQEIESKLCDRNQRHIGQAHGTFPTIPPFSEWINRGASSHISELILEGTFHPLEVNSLPSELIWYMKRCASLNQIPDTLTTTEWIGKISAWAKTTSTSPSGFHLTHSKALVAKHGLTTGSPAHAALEKQWEQLIQWQVDLLHVAIKHQYSFHRWKSIFNVMILKQPGNHKIHRLRVIHLYEHDYNLLLVIKWRSLIQQCVHTRKFNPGQYGGLPGHNAITPTILEELQYEINRASKCALVHLDHDATACYDRIILPMASLISRAHGQHCSIILINATTLKSARYLLKTQLGISSTSYSHSELFPIYGRGQGSGNSPGLWCAISSVLFDVYETQACGASFYSPDKMIAVKLYMIRFVDDTSGSTNDFLPPEPAPLHHYANFATHDAQQWNNILQLSGGALEDSKCSYHFMYYKFTQNGQPVLKGRTFDPAISIHFNNNNTPTSLKQLSAYTSHKMLGVYKNPDGNTTAAF